MTKFELHENKTESEPKQTRRQKLLAAMKEKAEKQEPNLKSKTTLMLNSLPYVETMSSRFKSSNIPPNDFKKNEKKRNKKKKIKSLNDEYNKSKEPIHEKEPPKINDEQWLRSLTHKAPVCPVFNDFSSHLDVTGNITLRKQVL